MWRRGRGERFFEWPPVAEFCTGTCSFVFQIRQLHLVEEIETRLFSTCEVYEGKVGSVKFGFVLGLVSRLMEWVFLLDELCME